MHGHWHGSAALRLGFLFSRRIRSTLIGQFDTSKRKISAAFDRCDWQSVLVISKNLLSKFLLDQVKRRLSCFSCAPAVSLKWLRVMAVLRMLRWIHRQRIPYVNHRPVLHLSEHAWNQLNQPVSNCHFLFPGFWVLKISLFNVRQMHSLVSKVVINLLFIVDQMVSHDIMSERQQSDRFS